MRVLHIVPSIAPDHGGPSRSVPRLVDALKEEGIDAILAASGGTGNSHLILKHLPLPGEILTPQSKERLALEISASDLVEIHSLWNGTTTAAAATCRKLKVPYVLTPRGMLDPACIANHSFSKRVYRRLFDDVNIRGASGFHFLSEDERDRAYVFRKLSEKETAVSPNGAGQVPKDLPVGLLRYRFPHLKERKVLLHLGRLDPIKRIDLQIQSLTHVSEEERPALLLIGSDFGDESRLRKLVKQLNLEPWIIFGGPLFGNERFSLLAEADLVLLTSVYDCNPVVATETFMMGGAMMATESCGLSAAARSGAVKIAPANAIDIARTIQTLLTDADALSTLRRFGTEYAGRHLSWDTVVKPLVRLYDLLAVGTSHPVLSRGA
jgi:glycosyltransferase involved in cell wall biosynthesis